MYRRSKFRTHYVPKETKSPFVHLGDLKDLALMPGQARRVIYPNGHLANVLETLPEDSSQSL